MNKLFLLYSVFSASAGLGQNPYKTNTLYFEFLGNGIGSSISYEKQLAKKPGPGVRVGVGYFSGDEKFRASVPLGVNYLLALKNTKSFIDVGLGATWAEASALKPAKYRLMPGPDPIEYIWSFVPSAGIRHHTSGNFMWRISATPVLNKYRTLPWLGFSLGKMF